MAKNAATKTAKSGQTKRLIVTTFLKLIEEKKWDRITVIEICRNAGVTRGTFYQYFSDIYDLMEQLETSLLEDLESRYRNCGHDDRKAYPIASFPVKYDYTPPAIFLAWFEFCRDHRDAMVALLNRINGETYFVKRLKAMISERIEEMMERDGMARDDLRSHFLKIFLELHVKVAKDWQRDPKQLGRPGF